MVVAVEVGGTKLQIAVGDVTGTITSLCRLPVDVDQGRVGIVTRIDNVIDDVVSESSRALCAIGVGFGGPVDRCRGRTVTSHQIDGWNDFPLAAHLSERYGVPTIVENDANVAALSEATCGAGRRDERVFYLTIGSGIGGGMVVDGRIYHGATPGECEIGHLRTPHNGEWVTVESIASGWAVDRALDALATAAPGGRLSSALAAQSLRTPNAAVLADACVRRESNVATLMTRVVDTLAVAISHVIHLFHPDVVIVGGGLAKLGDVLLKPIRERVDAVLMPSFRAHTRIVCSELGDRVVPIGALRLCADIVADGFMR